MNTFLNPNSIQNESIAESKLSGELQTKINSSSSGRIYTAGANIDITNDVISVTGITVPTKTSDLTNDSGFLTNHQSLSDYSTTSQMNTAISNMAAQIDAVKYDSSQSLTSAQKSQACSNIGAVSMDNFVTDGLYMRKNSAWTAVTKSDLLTILDATIETWTFTDDNNVQYEKEIIVLN